MVWKPRWKQSKNAVNVRNGVELRSCLKRGGAGLSNSNGDNNDSSTSSSNAKKKSSGDSKSNGRRRLTRKLSKKGWREQSSKSGLSGSKSSSNSKKSTHSSSTGRIENLSGEPSVSTSSTSSDASPNNKSASATVTSSSSKAKAVRFGDVEIRAYERTVGDNPSCSSGPPISIGWAHSTARFVDINSYEDGKSKRRSQSDLVLSREEREEILTMWGISFNDIVDAIRSNIKVKSQRRQTVTNLGKMQRIEEAFESATRKLKRTLLLQRRTGDKVKQLQEQADLAAAKAFSQLRFVEERTLSEIRSPKGRVETEPERDDHLEQLAVQVEVSNFCRTSPMESCLRSSVRSGGNGASMSSGNNRMGMNRSGTDSGNGSNGNANSNSQNNGNSNGKTDGNNTGSDGNSVDGRSVADRTTPSAMEMERFHRELEMEMFGEENFSLSDDLPPSMVGQTVEVGHFNDMEDDITMAADLLSAFAGTATAAAGYDGIAMEQQELENEEEQKQTSSHHAALHSNKSLDDFQSLYEDTDDFPVFFRSNIAKRNSMTSNHFPSTNDKMCVMPPSFPAHIYEAEEPIHGTSSNHDHDHYDDRQSQQPQPQQHWNVTEYAYIDEESYLPPPPPSLQKPKKKTSIILPQRYPVGEDYDPTYNSNAVTTTIDDTIIIHESFEYRSTPAGTIISEEDDTHEEEEKGSMDHRDFNGEYTAKHIDANYMPSHQHNNYTASDAHGGEGDEQWRQQQHQQTDDDDNDNNDDDNDEEDDGDNEPKIRHIPPPSYLTPSGWMEDYGGPSMRRFDPITISEDSAFMHQHQYQYQYQHQHQHHYQYQHQHHQYQHHNQQRATFPASFY